MTFGNQNPPPVNPNNGYVVPQPPDDTISRLRFSPETAPKPCLLAASWNGSVRLWEVNSSPGPATGIAEVQHPNAILDALWASDGLRVYYSTLDNLVTKWDLQSLQKSPVAQHDAPVRQCVDNASVGYLATASWDRTLRYWDVRAPSGKAEAVIPLSERAYSMDSLGYLMVLGLAGRRLVVFDVRKPMTPFQERYSQLRYQTRCVTCWPDSMGFIVAGVDGTVSVDYIQEHRQNENAVFTCHRDKGGSFSINAVRFNRRTGVFATAANDGHVFFWDKDRHSRAHAKRFERMPAPICDVDFYHDGSMYAYAVGYDWSQGADGNKYGAESNYIVLQNIEEGDMVLRDSNYNYSNRGRGRNRSRRGSYTRRPG